MATIYNFNEELASPTAVLQATDVVLGYSQASGVVQQFTGNQIAGCAAAPVNTTATTLTVTQASHGNRIITISSASPIAVTLPQATGTGTTYTFEVRVVATATGHTIKVANATDVMSGVDWAATTSSNAVLGYVATATDDTITLNGTTKGGLVGDKIVIQDVKTGFYNVQMFSAPTGSAATPFSATV